MQPSDKTSPMFPLDLLALEAGEGDTRDFPVYGRDLPAVLAPEHFLWQIKGRFPGFDEELHLFYRTQAEFPTVPKEHWPAGVLMPGDFYLQAFVIPQLMGGAPVQTEEDAEPPEEALDAGYGDEESEEPLDQPPFSPGEDAEQVVSIAQSRLAAANWEVYKDIVVYSPEDFRAIVAQGRGLKGHLPAALFQPVKSLGFWISLAGMAFDIHGEECLGCFVFRGWNMTGGETLSVGFVSSNSYYDYAIPLTPHASLDYIIESAIDFVEAESKKYGENTPMSPEAASADMHSAWGRILPVIIHVLEHLPGNVAMGRRLPPARHLLTEPLESRSVHLWRWSSASSRFSHVKHPSVLRGPAKRELLQEFVRSEEQGPIEVAEFPGDERILN